MKIPESIKRVLGIFRKEARDVFLYIALFFGVLAVTFYVLLGRGAANSLIEQTLHRQQLAVDAGSASVKSFFDLLGKSIILVSDEIARVEDDEKATVLQNFFDTWQDSAVGESEAIYVNEEGVVEVVASFEDRGGEGVDLSSREYFSWAQEAQKGDILIGSPIISKLGVSEGQYVIPIVSPVVSAEGEFEGLIATGVLVNSLVENHLEVIRFTETSNAYLFDEEANFIVAPSDILISKNIFGYLEENPFIGSGVITDIVRDHWENKDADKLELVLPEEIGTSWPLERKLIAYRKFDVGQERFLLALTVPASEALNFIGPFYIRQIGVLLLAFFALLILSVRLAKTKGFREGFKAHGATFEKESGKKDSHRKKKK